MNEALDAYYIRGVNHNISFLGAVIAHERFRAGRLTTHFIEEEFPNGFQAGLLPDGSADALVIAAAVVHQSRAARAAEISGQTRRFERAAEADWVVVINKAQHVVRVAAADDGFNVRVGDADHHVATGWQPGKPLFRAEIDGAPFLAQVDVESAGYKLFHRGTEVLALVLTARGAELARHMIEKVPPDLSRFLLSPMPGLLVRLRVQAGDEAKAGEELAVVEAMKMENSLRAANDLVVKAVLAQEGDSLEVDQPILEFE